MSIGDARDDDGAVRGRRCTPCSEAGDEGASSEDPREDDEAVALRLAAALFFCASIAWTQRGCGLFFSFNDRSDQLDGVNAVAT